MQGLPRDVASFILQILAQTPKAARTVLHAFMRLSIRTHILYVPIDNLRNVIRRCTINPPRSPQTYRLTMYLNILLIHLCLLLPAPALRQLRNLLLLLAHLVFQSHLSISQAMGLSRNLLLLPTITIDT